MFELFCVGWPACHRICPRNYWVVVYAVANAERSRLWLPGHSGFDGDPGPRLYLSLS